MSTRVVMVMDGGGFFFVVVEIKYLIMLIFC